MTEHTVSVSGDLHDRERCLDWLTALVPVLVMALIYYRWSVVVLVLPAIAGYLAASVGLQRLGVLSCQTVPALVTALLIAFCLPATTPLWIPAVAGGVAAGVAALPNWLDRRWGGKPFARPLLQPVLVGYLFVRFLFPGMLGDYIMPVQWTTVDGSTAPTSLVGLFDPTLAVSNWRLFFGIYPGGVGETCAAVLLLAGGYLLLRRRLRLVAPACMLAVVALLSWFVWGQPLYSVLVGGTLLGALLLGDRTVAPTDYGSQAAAGVLAGVVTVLLRVLTRTDGTAIGVVVACVLAPLYPPAGRLLRRLGGWLWGQGQKIFAKIREKQK